jgi:hypothetical protein
VAVDPRLERQARNEALMREVNQRVAELREQGSWGDDDRLMEIHCECGAFPDCDTKLSLPVEDYERVRAQDDRFAVAPGHESSELETVVERTDTWLIVDKLPQFDPLVDDDPPG